MDFDIDHGYRKPPAWHLRQFQKLGFKGHAGEYMGAFWNWNNKRRRINAIYTYATAVFSGAPVAGDVVSFFTAGLRTASPRVEKRPDGSVAVRHQQRYLGIEACDEGKPVMIRAAPPVDAGRAIG